MKNKEIIEKLKQDGFKIKYVTYEYWNNVEKVNNTVIAAFSYHAHTLQIDFDYEDVLKAIKHNCYDMQEFLGYKSSLEVTRQCIDLYSGFSDCEYFFEREGLLSEIVEC